MKVTYTNDEVYVIVDVESHALRKNDTIILDEEEAWSQQRQIPDSQVITLEEYLKEIE